RRAVEDESTAPVVVHVSDPSADQEAADEDTGDGGLTDAADADEGEDVDSQHVLNSFESTEEQAFGSNLETTPSANIIETDTGTKENNGDTLIFEAEAFSVYAIVYTVDFHYEINGKMYEFSIPGGGFVSLEHIVEVLGIVVSDTNNETNEIQEFVNNVDNIEFSNPELVSVSKIEEDTTVGAIKDNLGLERVYSAELTEEEIADINAQVIRTGDWALISLKPFGTEESLTITMKNGDQWIIKVTDAQKTSTNDLQQGDQYVIYIIKNGNYYALNSNGETYRVHNNDLDSLTSDYLWTYNNQENGTSHYAGSATWENGNNFLDVYWSMENPDPEYYWVNKYYPLSPTSKGWQPIVKMMSNGNNGFYFYDVNDYGRYLVNSNDNHVRTIEWNSYINWYHSYPPSPVSIYIYKQGSAYTVKAQPNNSGFGRVEYTHNNSTIQTSDENPFIEIQTVSTEEANKTIPDNIVAVPAEGYLFDGWTVVKEDWETVQVIDWGQGHNEFSETIKPTVDGNITLQAKFRPERQYHFTVRVNDVTMGTVGYEEDENTIVENLSSFESESNAVINDRSDNMYKITTNRKPMYKFLHWELRDAGGQIVRTYDASSLDPGEVELSEDGMELVAVYARKKDNEIDNIDINDFLDEWQETMINDFTGVDKTASVHDPANRIFEIDLTASSAKWEMERSLSLDFITDTSRSMFFPANLEYAKDTLAASTTTDLKSWLEDNGVSGDVYYVISNDDSATVFALFKEGNKWYYMDSSYYYYEESGAFSGTAQKREVPNGLYFAQTGGTNSGTAKTMTGIVYVSSDATDTYVSHQDSSIGQVYWSRLDYLYKAVEVATTTLKAIDPSASISLTTFNANSKREGDLPDNKEDIYAKLRRISPKGGTRQDRGLLSSYNGYNYTGSSNTATETGKEASEYGSAFSQGSEKKQVAILISDGAPNFGNSTTLGWDDIITQADLLKGVTDSRGENLTLMTLGLSLNFVHPDDLANFKGLATEGADGGYAINANSGAEIVESIKTLIKSLVDKADLYGTATDSLDPAFYPVMADGTPIENGSCFTTPADATDCCDSMHYIGKIPPSGNTPYLQWTKDGEVWTVTYYNQTFGWAETDTNGNVIEPGWKKAFYAKAKEDFLGGNTIETNGEASVTADKCIVHGTTVPRDLNESIEKTMESPHVNVKDLMFVGNDTKWTVYIESEVTPIEQIRELYKNIKVLEVVSESTDRMITDKDAMLYDQGTGNLIDGKTPEAFY
ncbi:MAG: vWA domain-containing protein, partial [Oscillospiraceae bacterium]|nr:vWA domain-containing protein [Oscillospiraceae bacterium]